MAQVTAQNVNDATEDLLLSRDHISTRNLLLMSRMLFVEDLVPGDRIALDGIRAVVRKQVPHGTDQRLVELAHSSDDRSELILKSGSKVEVY